MAGAKGIVAVPGDGQVKLCAGDGLRRHRGSHLGSQKGSHRQQQTPGQEPLQICFSGMLTTSPSSASLTFN